MRRVSERETDKLFVGWFFSGIHLVEGPDEKPVETVTDVVCGRPYHRA
jgi:hypothetical protein